MPRIVFIISFWLCFGCLAMVPLAKLHADPISLFTENVEMTFGTVIVDTYGDAITLLPNGSVSSQNLSIITGTASASNFSAVGDPNTAVTISFSSGDTLDGSGAAMPLGAFATNAGFTPAIDGSGNISFDVGATLTVNPNQVQGYYSGTYSVYIDYP